MSKPTTEGNPESDSLAGESSEYNSRPKPWIIRLIREPLLHFVLLGGILFAVYGYWNRGDQEEYDGQPIIVSAGKIEHLAALFSRTWQRPPTREELEGLIDDYVREEAAYREGTAMGLDSNDTIIRRRIRQKLEFVADDLASQLQPTEEELADYLRDHADDFRVDSRFSFRHVFFNPQRHGDDLDNMIGSLVVRLRDDESVDFRELGDRTLLEFAYENVSTRDVAGLFGKDFSEALQKIEPGLWYGPVDSSYGSHVVIIDEKFPGSLPDLQDIRRDVRREWEHVRREEFTNQFYKTLIEKYDVVVQWPEEAAE